MLMQGALAKRNPELADLPNALDFVKKRQDDRKVLELHFTQKTAGAPPFISAARACRLSELRH